MPTINRFEDIEAWQKGRELTRLLYQVTADPRFDRDRSLRDQLRRASVSILSNIAEGFERGGNREFRQFLSQAKGSSGGIKVQLYVALDAKMISEEQFDDLYSLATDVGRLVGGFVRYLSDSEIKGPKYR
jgi:four helix bundle protein